MFGTAGAPAGLANMVTGLIIFNKPDYVHQNWHTAMIMWLFIIVPLIFNLWFRKLVNIFETVGAIFHIVFFIVSIATLTALAQRSTPGYVFGTLVNDISGWTNPTVSWGIGLLTVTFPVVGKIHVCTWMLW
jgi:choline transport protein